jgi:ribosomal protein S18 acetylase RimI-like enzyme
MNKDHTFDSKEARRQIEERGVGTLVVDDLNFKDLENIAWSGGPAHPEAVRKALERVSKGEVDYMAIRDASGMPISIGGVDYSIRPGKGSLWQLATREELRGLGIGTKLITALEQRIKDRGLKEAVIGVEVDNPRARALYERLGYILYGQDKESWEEMDTNGEPYTYHADVDLLKKEL